MSTVASEGPPFRRSTRCHSKSGLASSHLDDRVGQDARTIEFESPVRFPGDAACAEIEFPSCPGIKVDLLSAGRKTQFGRREVGIG
jgi:hypothetical protein